MSKPVSMRMRSLLATMLAAAVVGAFAAPARALDDAHWQKANDAIERGIAYLRSTQNDDGSWSPRVGPAITALSVRVMLDRPDIGVDDPAVAKGLDYILDKAKPSGAIHDGILKNYNTAICLSALSRVDGDPSIAKVVEKATRYLKGLQWQPASSDTANSERIADEDHPYFGGAGYGHGGRPDMSNTNLMIQALRDAGVACTDPAYKRAVKFISRTQGVPQNDMHGDKIEQDGGFIYSTTLNAELPGVPESKANPELMDKAVEMQEAGKSIETIRQQMRGLRTYGSITYAGLKSYIYAMPAQLQRDDPRVQAALDWVRKNYTLEHNPGMPEDMKHQGQYYYYMTFARALNAWGSSTITPADGQSHDWANDLVDALVTRQHDDGSWSNTQADRWMEDNKDLVTGYALIALENALE
jgi:squalene-hopene/tetraprenyl-beta-curcumene cyclase